MQLTHSKLKYLLTAAELQKHNPDGFRGIDLAIQLGVSRASVRKMLIKFTEDGYLSHGSQFYYVLTKKGAQEIERYHRQYLILHEFFCKTMGLTDFEAKECALTLLSTLPVAQIERICDNFRTQKA